MNISGFGNSDFNEIAAPGSPRNSAPTGAGSSIGGPANSTESNALTNDEVNTVMDETTNYAIGTSVNYLFYRLNPAVQARSGSSTDVQSAVDNYLQSLASSNVYDSSYTAPSSQFLGALSALKSDAGAGDWDAAQIDLAQARQNAPLSVADGISLAIAKGDTAGEAALMAEGTANMRDALAAYGYSQTAATAEADAITINGLVGPSNPDARSILTRLDQIIDLATGLADGSSPAGDGNAAASNSPLFHVIEDLLEASSPEASNQVLANLDRKYGSIASRSTASSISSSSSSSIGQTTMGVINPGNYA